MELLIGIVGLSCWAFFCIKTGGLICPPVVKKFYMRRSDLHKVRFGRFPCPKCGALVEVDH